MKKGRMVAQPFYLFSFQTMHISRCDDPAYLSFARQLLRSLSNVKNGIVTKHIGDVTVTVRKVFGHEYVSIASGVVGYEFFTTGDLYNTLEGLDLVQLASTTNAIIPRGYFIRAKSNGEAQLFLSTNEPFIGEKPVPYTNQHAFFDKVRRVNRPLQVSLITEPVYESSFGHRCFSVWSQRPTPYTDVEYDIVGNKLHGLSTKPHVADTDWTRTVAITTRVHTDVNGVKTKVELMVVVTQTWDVVIYKISDASEPMYDHPTYPQLGLTTKSGAGVVRLEIPTPAAMDKNTFDGSARETYGSNKESYFEKHRNMCVRINPDCTKLCFNYDEVPSNWGDTYKLNCFVEFELNIELVQSGEIVASLQKLQSIDSGSHRMRVLDCDYLMPSKGGLAKKFEDLGCKTGDLIVLCQYVTADAFRAYPDTLVYADDNYYYVVNQTTGVVLVEIPSDCSLVDSERFGMEIHSMLNMTLYFEFIDLKSLSFALTIEDARGAYLGGQGVDKYKAAYALFVHGKKFASAGAFDILFNTPVKKQTFGFLADRWSSQLDPTHNFVCDTFGNWSYHSFFYCDFFGTRLLIDSNGVTGEVDESFCLRKTFTHPKNMLTFKDAFAFDFVVFSKKNADGYTEKITSHKELFEKATGLKFNTRWHIALINNGVSSYHNLRGGSGVPRYEAWGQINGSIKIARDMLKAYPVYQRLQDSTLIVNCPIVSAAGLFA